MVQCKIFFGKYLFSENAIFGKGKYFQVFGCIKKIFLENNFMCLVTPENTIFHHHTTGKPPKHHHPHHHNNNKKNQRSKRESKKSKSHKERDRFVGSWREGSGLPVKSKALGQRSVHGFVDRFVERRSRRRDLGSLSLSLYVWVRKWFEVKILTETNFRVKAIKTHGQLKIFSKKFIFHA